MEPARTKQNPGNRLLRSNATSQSPNKKVTIGPRAKTDLSVHENTGTASIDVKRGEQGVESIEVICGCGERIVIRCEYDE